MGAIMASPCVLKISVSRSVEMPTLFRFLFIVGMVSAIVVGGLYVLAIYFEPEPREVSKPVAGVKIRK